MMRLLFCESSQGFGGQESQILLQMEALEAAGHSVHLACPAGSRLAVEAGRRGLPWTPVSFRNSLHVASILHVRNLLMQERMDAVICHSGHDANVAAIAARLSGRRRIRVLRIRTYLGARVRPLTVNFLADRTLAPSNFLLEKISRSPGIKPERVGLLRPIVSLEQLFQQAREPLDSQLSAWLDAHSPILVHAAMLRSQKGHRMALDALKELKVTFPNIGYVMAGFGTNESELRHLVASQHLTPHVFFAGMVSPVAPLLTRANVVIMPSTSEPLGLAQMEALALGVPVAVSNAGGLPETVTDQKTGRIFPQGDVGAWILGLTEMLNATETSLLQAKVGKIFVEENFSAAAHVESLLRHLKEIGATR
jgi:glycosyltransferase involved in cell wall biosynthesis